MRTFLLMLASAFFGVVLFVAAVYGYFYWQHSKAGPGATVRFPPRSETTVSEVPPIVEAERFYGSHAGMIGEFPMNGRNSVLAAGPGKLAGGVTSGGKPVHGLRLRLALNGAVMSQWATTGADGRYAVPLPYGKYRVDGYELDSSTAERLLAGKTDDPRQGFHRRETTVVTADRPGQGLDLAYVDPVRKLGPEGEVTLGQPVIVKWQAYPGAAAYRLQLVEQREPRDYESHRRVFEWRDRPVVTGTSVDLAAYQVALKKDHYHVVEIEALDDRNLPLSHSARSYDKADFRVVE